MKNSIRDVAISMAFGACVLVVWDVLYGMAVLHAFFTPEVSIQSGVGSATKAPEPYLFALVAGVASALVVVLVSLIWPTSTLRPAPILAGAFALFALVSGQYLMGDAIGEHWRFVTDLAEVLSCGLALAAPVLAAVLVWSE